MDKMIGKTPNIDAIDQSINYGSSPDLFDSPTKNESKEKPLVRRDPLPQLIIPLKSVTITENHPLKDRNTATRAEDSPVKNRVPSLQKGAVPVPVTPMLEDDELDYSKKSPMHRFIDHPKIQLILLVVTLYSLFADDYRVLSSKKQVDRIYDVFCIICLVVFAFEIVVAAIWKPMYMSSYYFYLDIISTASLILDFSPVSDAIIVFGYTGNSGISKIGNLLKLIRLFRLVRISKIYKSLSASEDKQVADGDHMVRQKSSKTDSLVGRRLSELATKAVIIMCFMLLILLPLFNADFWISSDIGTEGAGHAYKTILKHNFTDKEDTKFLEYKAGDLNATSNFRQTLAYTTSKLVTDFKTESSGALLKVLLPHASVAYFKEDNFTGYRLEEMIVGVVAYNGSIILIHQDGLSTNTIDAILSIIRTFYICAILLGGSSLFNYSTYKLIIEPIEDMTEKVRQVSEKPQKVKEKAFIEAEENEVKQNVDLDKGDDDEEEEDLKNKNMSMETFIIKDAITKIGILLGVGLGEAGSSLIGTYLRNTKDSDNDVLMKNVCEMNAIFGFCDIRNFTDATEVLQEGVMVFVNTVGNIVHTIADRNLGAANKNVGDAFLIVWKIPGSLSAEVKWKAIHKTEEEPPADFVEEHNKKVFANLADLALFAVMKIFAEINRSYDLVKYVQNEGLKKRIGAGYKVRIGFGLHYGWAIEGAMGSFHKVDVSYLSPHVNIAGFLESETKSYGAALLMSTAFYDLLTPEIKKFCRKIDILKTADGVMSVYTPNMSDKAFDFPKQEPLKQHILKTKECYTFKKLLKNEILADKYIGPALFENDIDIRLLVCRNNNEFIDTFNLAFAALERGDWSESQQLFEKAHLLEPSDPPTKHLLEYVTTEHPPTFPGYIGHMGGGH